MSAQYPTIPRIPTSCPAGFQRRYTVVAGDTMYGIAQRFNVSLDRLVQANPHIPDPARIIPGDVLCVPGVAPQPMIPLPCSIVLWNRSGGIDTLGTALIFENRMAERLVSILAYGLPSPTVLGNFDAWEGVLIIPGDAGLFFGTILATAGDDTRTWAGTRRLDGTLRIPPDAFVLVRPVNLTTGITGSTVLSGSLEEC